MALLDFLKKTKTKSFGGSIIFNDWEIEYSSEKAFRNNPVVYQCIKILCRKVLSIPLKIYKMTDDGVEEVPDTEIEIFVKPNEYQSFSDIIKMMISWRELWGTSYLYVVRGANRKPVKIYALRSSLITPIYGKERLYEKFLYKVGEKAIELNPEDVIVFKNDNPFSDREGISTIEILKDLLAERELMTKLNRGVLSNASKPPGILYTEQHLSPQEINSILELWQRGHSGENFGKIALLTGGLKFQEVGLKLADALFLEQVKLNKRDVASVFGVPPMFLGDYDFANYKVSEQRKNFYYDTIIPLCKDIENLFNSTIMYDFGKEYWCEFDFSTVPEFQEDEEKKANVSEKYVKNGIMTINEIRVQKGLEPVPWGDTWWVGVNNVPVSGSIEKQKEEKEFNLLESRLGINYDVYWKFWDLRLRPQEKRLKKVVSKFFQEQKKRIYKKIFGEEIKQFDLDFLFDMSEEVEELIKTLKPFLTGFIISEAEAIASLFDIGIDFSLFDGIANEYVGHTLPFISGEINQTTLDELKSLLEQAQKEGWSIDQVKREILNKFDEFSSVRAERIARTEIIGANNHAAYMTYKMAGFTVIRWITARDDKVRDSHRAMEGVEADINEGFYVNGYRMLYPGDHNGPPEEVINCRCTIAPVR